VHSAMRAQQGGLELSATRVHWAGQGHFVTRVHWVGQEPNAIPVPSDGQALNVTIAIQTG